MCSETEKTLVAEFIEVYRGNVAVLLGDERPADLPQYGRWKDIKNLARDAAFEFRPAFATLRRAYETRAAQMGRGAHKPVETGEEKLGHHILNEMGKVTNALNKNGNGEGSEQLSLDNDDTPDLSKPLDYYAWIANRYDLIPPDALLAAQVGLNRRQFSGARDALTKQGYVFKRNVLREINETLNQAACDAWWTVSARPEPEPEPEPKDPKIVALESAGFTETQIEAVKVLMGIK
jgi:hypothetical protein